MDDDLAGVYDGLGDPLEGLPDRLVERLARSSVCADCVHAIWTTWVTPEDLAKEPAPDKPDHGVRSFSAQCSVLHEMTFGRRHDDTAVRVRWCSRQQKTGKARPQPDRVWDDNR